MLVLNCLYVIQSPEGRVHVSASTAGEHLLQKAGETTGVFLRFSGIARRYHRVACFRWLGTGSMSTAYVLGVDDGVPSLAPEHLACAVPCLRHGRSDYSGGSWEFVWSLGELGKSGSGRAAAAWRVWRVVESFNRGRWPWARETTAVFFCRFAGICDVLTPRERGTRAVVLSRPRRSFCFWVVGHSPDRIVYAEKSVYLGVYPGCKCLFAREGGREVMSRSKTCVKPLTAVCEASIVLVCWRLSTFLCSGSRGRLVRPRVAAILSRVYVQSVLCSACPTRSTGHDWLWLLGPAFVVSLFLRNRADIVCCRGVQCPPLLSSRTGTFRRARRADAITNDEINYKRTQTWYLLSGCERFPRGAERRCMTRAQSGVVMSQWLP